MEWMREEDKGRNKWVIEDLKDVLGEVISKGLGETVKEVILFHMRLRLGRDPFDTLWEEPTAFYRTLRELFGDAADLFIDFLVGELRRRYAFHLSKEELLKFLTDSQKSSLGEWHELLRNISYLPKR
ncbi:MAG: hypothetical protein QXN08_03200 [Nitrososphaerales archaeon]